MPVIVQYRDGFPTILHPIRKLQETRVVSFHIYEVISMLNGKWGENMHEVLMKTMCSNHSNTLLQPSKLPSCNSENYEGRK